MNFFSRKRGNHPRAEIVLGAIRAEVKIVSEIEARQGFSSAPDYHEELLAEANKNISDLKSQVERLSSGSAAVWKTGILEFVDDALRTKNLRDKKKFLADAAKVVDEYLSKN